jgi:hypothetical protein
MQIDGSDEHSQNASLPITESSQSDANVRCERAEQPEKQASGSALRKVGIPIDASDVH